MHSSILCVHRRSGDTIAKEIQATWNDSVAMPIELEDIASQIAPKVAKQFANAAWAGGTEADFRRSVGPAGLLPVPP